MLTNIEKMLSSHLLSNGKNNANYITPLYVSISFNMDDDFFVLNGLWLQ